MMILYRSKELVNRMTLNILIVDQDLQARDRLQQALTAAGMLVTLADDGVEALHSYENNHLDAIITEIALPRLDGLGLIAAVRNGASRPHTPILVLSSDSPPDQMSKARRAGANGWILKPFDPVKIVTALNAVID